MNKDIQAYHDILAEEDRAIAELLHAEICHALPAADSKIWHRHPVWFIEGNPVVGYDKLKDCMRLLFWSGQSFEEQGLAPEGKFKAAEKRYISAKEINKTDLKRWLKKSRDIQWDYKNIVKRKGRLELIQN